MTHRPLQTSTSAPRTLDPSSPDLEDAPLLYAGDVAGGFADAAGVDDDERARLHDVAMAVGAYVAQRGYPGNWMALDPADFYGRLPTTGRADPVGVTIRLVGMLLWMALEDWLPREHVVTTLDAIEAAGPKRPWLADLIEAGRCRLARRAS